MANYNSLAIQNLKDATQYESWFLENIYAVSEAALFPAWPDTMTYLPGGKKPNRVAFGSAVISLGDWRPGFLLAGAPLIFATTFKLLDMVVEWILEQNGHQKNFRFSAKIELLSGAVEFPPFFQSRSWLTERFLGLYKRLEPIRGGIIHSNSFSTDEGGLEVSTSRGNAALSQVNLTPSEIRTFAVVAISVLRYLTETWVADDYKEMVLRFGMDELSDYHGMPKLGRKRPCALTVRKYVLKRDVITLDFGKMYEDVCAELPDNDVVFDVRLVVLQSDGSHASSYLYPWGRFCHERGKLDLTLSQLGCFMIDSPVDFNLNDTRKWLGLSV